MVRMRHTTENLVGESDRSREVTTEQKQKVCECFQNTDTASQHTAVRFSSLNGDGLAFIGAYCALEKAQRRFAASPAKNSVPTPTSPSTVVLNCFRTRVTMLAWE